MPPNRMSESDFSVVLVTCPVEASERIARAVVDARCAACVNVLPAVRSMYRWKGKVEEAEESLLLIKTRSALLGELERAVKLVHPYEVPEIVALPVARGHRPYLEWIAESTALRRSQAPTPADRMPRRRDDRRGRK